MAYTVEMVVNPGSGDVVATPRLGGTGTAAAGYPVTQVASNLHTIAIAEVLLGPWLLVAGDGESMRALEFIDGQDEYLLNDHKKQAAAVLAAAADSPIRADLRKVNGADATPATDVAKESSVQDLVEAVEGIKAGGGVLVLPAVGVVGDRTLGMSLNPKVGETVVASVTLYWQDGVTPYSLAGRTVCVVFEDRHGEDVAVVPSGDLMVHGESENVVSFAYPEEVTSEERVLRAAIVEEAAPKAVHIEGLCNVTRAPMVDQ